ncbi:sensor histidine kinase [Conexibacter woesei]|uniref:histidine kinase n=1 Tax=Conexibacter woesei (strain DSM 14684 / CCUG 47730 / CIP 108061 / JCM 11494 / NBRC 100937 / ID131577) TaxID=469383 RepID=D3FA27_CONWI|nr:ATP-binding protein [Conexibacter woesei]ADB53122.1 integral membrane sensor signal transduction histidine kinase [Conexibacter woesei DSM 14684]
MSARGGNEQGSRWRWMRGLRARLALSISVILVVALATAFIATYRGTGTEVRNQIDEDLRTDAIAFDQSLPVLDVRPRALAQKAETYLQDQTSFGATTRLYIVRIRGGGTVSNLPELNPAEGNPGVERDIAGPRRESDEARALRTAHIGFSTVRVNDEPLRLYFIAVERGGRPVAEIGVGEWAAAVGRAQSGVARTFVFAGTVTLVAAIVLGFAFASRLSRPLRRMASTAAEVTAGDLSQRISSTGPRDEVRVLADAFDRMLDRLENAFERQRGFVADASHELRTPLTVIRGQLEVLARQTAVTPADVRHVDEVVRTEVLRMERLVDDLLLLARADEGELVRPHSLDLAPFVTELFDALTLTADRAFELGELPQGRLLADEDRVAQVLRNLARNAVEHTGPGGLVRLTVRVLDRTQVEFAIEDDGPGIPPEQRDRVFDRFHRTDSARARRTGGAGLGLAIARAIVEAHGGTIAAGSSPEGGARVAFTLPGFRAASKRAGKEPARS